MSPKGENYVWESISKRLNGIKSHYHNTKLQSSCFMKKKQKHMCQLRNPMAPLRVRSVNKIHNLNNRRIVSREYLERPCNFQMTEKVARKPIKESMEGFEYSSLWTSKTYSILSYIVGGFVGSKSQMNNSKHNLSYDLSAAIFNLLNPCKYEREKGLRKSDNFYNTTPKISSESYDKYIVKSSQKEKMNDVGLEWLENYILELNELNTSRTTRDFNCDENEHFSDSDSTTERSNLVESVDVLDRVLPCGDETPNQECLNQSVNFIPSDRLRQLSECSIESTDSESFIIFDSPSQSEESRNDTCWRLENFDFDSEPDDEDEDEDDSSCDEYDVQSADNDVAEANDKWLKNYEGVEAVDDEGQKKVRFNEDVKVNKIIAWDFAYRAARTGPWEQMARDRARFRQRILQLSRTLSPILKKKHRDKIYKKLYS